MSSWDALIQQPWNLAPDTLLGATALALGAALVGEVLWRAWRWPRLMGYALVGTALALSNRSLELGQPVVRVVVDIGLAVLLFEAGSRVNLRWLRHNLWLCLTSFLESAVTAAAVWLVATQFGLSPSQATMLALVLMASSPAMVLHIASELRASGQVTERAITLSTLNLLYAAVGMQLFNAGLRLAEPDSWWQALSPVAWSFVGSLALAAVVGELINQAARRFDLRHHSAALLMALCVVLALVMAKTLGLSTLIVPLLAGLWLRNRSQRPWVWPQHFGSLGTLLVMGLFVIANASWIPSLVAPLLGVAAALMGARWLAKWLSLVVLSRPSGLSMRQTLWLSLALAPISTSALVLGAEALETGPSGVDTVWVTLIACMALLECVSPWIVAKALRAGGDVAESDNAQRSAVKAATP